MQLSSSLKLICLNCFTVKYIFFKKLITFRLLFVLLVYIQCMQFSYFLLYKNVTNYHIFSQIMCSEWSVTFFQSMRCFLALNYMYTISHNYAEVAFLVTWFRLFGQKNRIRNVSMQIMILDVYCTSTYKLSGRNGNYSFNKCQGLKINVYTLELRLSTRIHCVDKFCIRLGQKR